MGRRKLPLELISNERSRRTTYKKRKNGLMKKAEEFSILCGVDTCVIIYGPNGGDSAIEPSTWPPNHQEIERIIDRYQSEGKGRTRRTMGLLEFFAMRKKKVDNELEKTRLACLKAKFPVADELITNITENQRETLLATLATRLEVAKKLLAKKKQEATHKMNHNMMVDDLYYSMHNQYLQVHGMFQEQQTPPLVQSLDVKPPLQLQYNPTSYLPPAIDLEKENEWQKFVDDLYYSMHNQYLQGHGMFQEQQTPLLVQSLDVKPPLQLEYNPTSYLPPAIDLEKENEWQKFGVLADSNHQFYSINPSASIYYPMMDMSSMQANNVHHAMPSLVGSTSNNNFSQNLLMAYHPSLNGSVQIDQPIQMQDNTMNMFNPSSSSIFYDTSATLPLQGLMQYPFNASIMDVSKGN